MYEGWDNRETWNVALWINNDEFYYNLALGCDNYDQFIERVPSDETCDGIAWNDPLIDKESLDDMIEENKDES